MTWIGEIKDFIELILKIKKCKKSSWKKLDKNEIPSWVERASHKFHSKYPVKNHDKRKDFKGKYYLYRVHYQKSAHGRIKEEFYRKKLK